MTHKSTYKPNPKTKGSGIICAIPQKGRCPHGCPDCFFQSGRSYLEPLAENLPNLPPEHDFPRVVRVNDGHDSGVDVETVVRETARYPLRFYNTILPDAVARLPGPVVLTVNPGRMTDVGFHVRRDIPSNLMMVRVRVNAWNVSTVVDNAVEWYARVNRVPVILTFMAYHEQQDIPAEFWPCYVLRKRTLNPYWAITSASWKGIMDRYAFDAKVHSCGRVEGELGSPKCIDCGNCLREFYATYYRMYPSPDEGW